jgi:hypothetical protein
MGRLSWQRSIHPHTPIVPDEVMKAKSTRERSGIDLPQEHRQAA